MKLALFANSRSLVKGFFKISMFVGASRSTFCSLHTHIIPALPPTMGCVVQLMALSAPPPPPRQSRQPFITAFIADVFSFLGPKDLLVCVCVAKVWMEEANALSLWRQLLLSNRDTAESAYSGLSLKEMQVLALRKEMSINELELKMSLSPMFTVSNNLSASSTVENRVNDHLRGNVPNRAVMQSFSAGIKSKLPFDEKNLSLTRRIISLEENAKNISTHLERFNERYHDCLDLSGVSNQREEIAHFALFCDNCAKKLREYEIFEEIIVNSFSRCFSIWGLRGIRSFAHLEMVTQSEVGSPAHLEWCKFKNLLPLNSIYFDCLDFLYKFGSCQSQLSELNVFNEDWGKQQLERFSVLHTHVENIVKQRNGELCSIDWNEILKYFNHGKG